MVLIISVTVIFLVSFIWALLNLFSELNKPKQIKKIKENLQKEKILFKKS